MDKFEQYLGIISNENLSKLKSVFSRLDKSNIADLMQSVSAIVDDVRTNKDSALVKYSTKFDNYDYAANDLRLDFSTSDLKNFKQLDTRLQEALEVAYKRILKFHKMEVKNSPGDWSYKSDSGERLGVRYNPLDSVAVYIPAGRAPLLSTVLMTVIPAKVAGVKRIVLLSPPPINPAILAAAELCGVDEVYQVGGAQAIAAAAYGTETVKPVDKIVGPGNIYVTLAKKIVFGDVGIDGVFGPSELAIIADETSDVNYLALDLLTQLEHGSGLESVLFVTNKAETIGQVQARIELELQSLLMAKLKTEDEVNVIHTSLAQNSAFLLAASAQEMIAIANLYAPEHLELQVSAKLEKELLAGIKNAGAIFVGANSCESLGDYAAGPSHCLPTGTTARFTSGLQVADFITKTSLIDFTKVSKRKFVNLIDDVALIARAEGLELHARAIELRKDN